MIARTSYALAALALGLLAAACGDSTPPEDTTRNLSKQAGDGQTGVVGQQVAVAPAVKVTNGSGTAVAGVAVTFAVASGGGSITGAAATTDPQGVATVGGWTLGTAVGANTLTAQLAGGSPVTFSATAAAGAVATIEKTAGDNQTATVKTAVPVSPAVLLKDQFGNPVSGVAVTFAVGAGGGTISGATQTSNATGNATVGAWQLGPTDGVNRLTVTVQGATASATFVATARELLLQPSQDTTFSAGTINVTRLIVPAGRTITLAGAVVINVDSTASIAGTIRGNCVGFTLNGEQQVTVTGTINNACTAPTADAPGLKIIAKGGYSFDGAGTFNTSGDGEFSNDATPLPIGAHHASGATALAGGACNVRARTFVASARVDGTNGKEGTDGRDGRTWTLRCTGADLVLDNVGVFGQDGGFGGNGVDTNGDPANAKGGRGGKGGLIRVAATGGRVVFQGATTTIQSGDGGDGGSATATAKPTKAGQKAANAKAKGGDGAEAGLIEVTSDQGIVGAGLAEFKLGRGGQGGDATATGANGVAGQSATTREQDGGDADAEGGNGAGTPAKRLIASGAVAGVPSVIGGNAQRGGHATATAGNGAAGTEDKPDGGHGGTMRAKGGKGGDALATKLGGADRIGNGANGGNATFGGGNGGAGQDNCAPPPIAKGGDGGNGGGASGGRGLKGIGLADGTDGVNAINTAGNGGEGGDGDPEQGKGGAAGVSTVDGAPNEVEPSFVKGNDGKPCPQLFEVTRTAFDYDHTIGVSPCPDLVGSFNITNTSDQPLTITSTRQGPNVLLVVGLPVTIPPGQSRSVQVFFNCGQAASFNSILRLAATQGATTQTTDITVNGVVSYEAVKLDIALGTFGVGTVIPLANVRDFNAGNQHGENCAVRHLHALNGDVGIRIVTTQTFGPFPEPVERRSGCGYGEIIKVKVPATGQPPA